MMRTSLAVKWLRLSASNAGSTGSILGQGTKNLHSMVKKNKKIIQDDESGDHVFWVFTGSSNFKYCI